MKYSIGVYEIENLENTILHYQLTINHKNSDTKGNNANFNKQINILLNSLLGEGK